VTGNDSKRHRLRSTPPPPRAKMQRVSDDSGDGEPPALPTEPIRFLGKAEVTALCNVTAVTIWKWMQQDTFPKGREVGGKTCWRSDEIADWQNKRPIARVKSGASS
jgi:predicted DNA-binding transcriptional regulator AlpA